MSVITKVQYDLECDNCNIHLMGVFLPKHTLNEPANSFGWKADNLGNHYCKTCIAELQLEKNLEHINE